jgi:hypothetical protein
VAERKQHKMLELYKVDGHQQLGFQLLPPLSVTGLLLIIPPPAFAAATSITLDPKFFTLTDALLMQVSASTAALKIGSLSRGA